MLNEKLGGNIENIQLVGKYFVEVWKASGMRMDNVKFLWASEEINRRPAEYWMMVMDIARKNTIARIQKCSQIMGRKEGSEMKMAQFMYPCM